LDQLGGLNLSCNFFGEMISQLQDIQFGEMISQLQDIQPKIVCALEGGYNLKWIGKCFLSQLGQMMNHSVKFDDSVIEDIKGELGKYWKI